MWLDTNDCDQRFHEFLRDCQTGRWIVRHADGEECEECEFEFSEELRRGGE